MHDKFALQGPRGQPAEGGLTGQQDEVPSAKGTAAGNLPGKALPLSRILRQPVPDG